MIVFWGGEKKQQFFKKISLSSLIRLNNELEISSHGWIWNTVLESAWRDSKITKDLRITGL